MPWACVAASGTGSISFACIKTVKLNRMDCLKRSKQKLFSFPLQHILALGQEPFTAILMHRLHNAVYCQSNAVQTKLETFCRDG